MRKKFKIILALACAALTCVGLGSCAAKTKVDENVAKGYKIVVTYDPNGGTLLKRPGMKLIDMFNPNDYEVGTDGKVHIKLLEPTSEDRNSGTSDEVTLTMSNHFFAGWYQNREVKTVDGVPVDVNGEELTQLENGTYVYSDTVNNEKPTTATPAYIYSGYWDFENDTIDYSEEAYAETDGVYKMTLYAGWVPYYEFHYYYRVEGESSDWTEMGTSSFDYKETNAEGSTTADRDTIFLPTWQGGKMNYSYMYADKKQRYNFPSIENTTFKAAYLDEACTEQITTPTFEHQGTLDKETCGVEGRVQNIYVILEKGIRYRIETAQQLVANATATGIYEITADLDFTNLSWPNAFAQNTFKGKMYSTEGNKFKISNASALYATSTKAGGLFGTIAAGAEVKDLDFVNATFDLATMGNRNHDASYGLFAGIIEDGAQVSNVSVGGTFRLGEVTPGNNPSFNLWANGNTSGLTKNKVKIQVYGAELIDYYNYTVDPNSVEATDEEGGFSFALASGDARKHAEASIDIDLQ